MDEQAERAKLELLDLTEDVIEMILDKKRKSYERVKKTIIGDVIPEPVEDLEQEPTFYPPVETQTSVQLFSPSGTAERSPSETAEGKPVEPEPPMDRSLDPKRLPWRRRL